jgi:hypothetical protein
MVSLRVVLSFKFDLPVCPVARQGTAQARQPKISIEKEVLVQFGLFGVLLTVDWAETPPHQAVLR